MNGDRGLRILCGLLRGEAGDVTAAELRELRDLGMIASVDPILGRRADALAQLAPRYDLTNLDTVRAALADLDGKLRSDWHRMICFDATLRREERDRVELRMVAGFLGDAAERAKVEDAVARRQLAAHGAPWVDAVDGQAHAVTRLGWGCAFALQVRLERYAQADFAEFAKRYKKADAGMAKLAADFSAIDGGLTRVPKGKPAVVLGLLKSGLPPGQALAHYDQALHASVGGLLGVEAPHVATGLVRASAANGDLDAARQRFQAMRHQLGAIGFRDGPVVRGAAKALAASALEPTAAAVRYKAMYDGLSGGHEARLKVAARLFGAPGRSTEVIGRYATAFASFHDPEIAAPLAAYSTDDATLAALIAKFTAIRDELLSRRAFRSRVPASAVDLLNVPGTPAEVVELVRQLVAHLPAREHQEAWGESADWVPAVAMARRFAY
jgi:hypothetical protein